MVAAGFVRITTSSRIYERPIRVKDAVAKIKNWSDHPHVRMVSPGPGHLEIWSRLLDESGAAGNLTTDAHLAALAIENRATLYSCDADFSRFPGLRWRNPLK